MKKLSKSVVYLSLFIFGSICISEPIQASPGPGYMAIYKKNYSRAKKYLRGKRVKKILDPMGEWINTMPYACNSGDARIIMLLIKRGGDVNQKDRNGDNICLQLYAEELASRTVEYGKKMTRLELKTLKFIIQKTKDINYHGRPYGFQKTPLIKASYSGGYPVIKMLLEQGADVKLTDRDSRTPLHQLTYGVVAYLSFVEKVNWNYYYKSAKLYVKYKADLDVKDHYKNTPYDYLLKVNKKTIFSPNAAEGLKVIEKMKILLKPKNELSPREEFFKAIGNLDFEGVKKIVSMIDPGERKSFVSHADEKKGFMTALHMVLGYAYEKYEARGTALKMIQFLINNGANLNARDKLGRTPVMLAFGLKLNKMSAYLYNLNPELHHYQTDGCQAGLNVFHFAVIANNPLYKDMLKKNIPTYIYKDQKKVSAVWLGNFNLKAMIYLLENKIVAMDWEFYEFVQKQLKDSEDKYKKYRGDFAKQSRYIQAMYHYRDVSKYLKKHYEKEYENFKKRPSFSSGYGESNNDRIPAFLNPNVKKSPFEAFHPAKEFSKKMKKN